MTCLTLESLKTTRRLLTAAEIGEILRVSPQTVYQWAELRQMPHLKINGALRFDSHDILNWLQECRKEPLSSYNPAVGARKRERKK
ncbi:MAG: helix-turn-helix domain-containing protein [Dissulfurispiraceae bacterium]